MKAIIHNKKTSCLYGLILILMLLCGCTQHDGHIGDLFGSWALIEITRDGEQVEFEYETVFSFQNEIVRIVGYVDQPYYAMTRYGNFTHEGDALTLKFASEPTPTNGRGYMAPEWLYFPKEENILHFDVRHLTGSALELTLVSNGICYTFKKTW